MYAVGQSFPNFELQDQTGAVRTLEEFLGNPFIVYFYPKDDTSGCTVEACEFTELVPNFGDIRVIGISPDSAKKHANFVKKHNLNLTLLADVERTLIEPYGLWIEKVFYGRKYMGVDRTTILVGADGKVERIWVKVNPEGHAAEVLAAIKGS